jgi:GNAT superfamily N-acetyltransferase
MAVTDVRPATPADAPFVRATLENSWATTTVAVHGELIDATDGPALIAWLADERVGLATYRPDDTGWELLSLDAILAGSGVGTALLTALTDHARDHGARRVWLVTTNENTTALRFYQRRGFDLVAVHRDAVAAARRLKPEIPDSADGIPIRHELELERML